MAIHLDFVSLIDELRVFILRYWPLLLAVGFVDGMLSWMYIGLRDRYLLLLPAAVGIVAAATLAVIAWYYRLSLKSNGYRWWGLALLSTLLFTGGITWQAVGILNPSRFSPDEFGIAVARFGEGADFHSTRLSLDITDQVIRSINETTQKNPGLSGVRVMPAGLVKTASQAQQLGRHLDADLVVWGQVVRVGSGAISIHYEISQSLDQVSNPAFPMLLPAESRFMGTGTRIPLETEKIHQWVSQQGRMIASFILGLSAHFNRDYSTAMEQFKIAANTIQVQDDISLQDEDTRLGLIYFYLGRSNQLLGKLEDGEFWLRQAELQMQGDPVIPLSLAYGYNSLGREDEVKLSAEQAIELATVWLNSNPGNNVVAYNRGLALAMIDKHRRATFEFDLIIKENPNFYVAYLSSGRSYMAVKEHTRALERFQEAIELAEREGINPAWGYLFLAEGFEAVGAFDQAERHYKKSIDLAPQMDWMRYRMGNFYSDRGQIEDAQESYQKLIEVAFDKAWAHSVMAKFLRDQGHIEEAIREFEIVHRERIFDTLSQIYLAELYLQTGQPEDALDIYQEALERTPELEYGRISFGRALFELGEYGKAIEQFKSALEINPENVITRFNLGRAYEADVQLEQALTEYEAILEMPIIVISDDIWQAAGERISAIHKMSSATPTPSITATATLALGAAPTPSSTAAATPTVPAAPTPSPTATATLALPAAPTPSPTATATLALPAAPTPSSTAAATPTVPAAPTPSSTAAATPTSTLPPPPTPINTISPETVQPPP
jgi:tetratricopeptide (TPR) repeat protein